MFEGLNLVLFWFVCNTALQVHKAGQLIRVGDSRGSASVIELDKSLVNSSKLDRSNASDMFDRCEAVRR